MVSEQTETLLTIKPGTYGPWQHPIHWRLPAAGTLLLVPQQEQVALYDVGQRQVRAMLPKPAPGELYAFDDEQHLLCLHPDQPEIVRRRIDQWQVVQRYGLPAGARGIPSDATSPRYCVALGAGFTGSHLWDKASGKLLKFPQQEEGSDSHSADYAKTKIAAVSISNDETKLAIGALHQFLMIVDLRLGGSHFMNSSMTEPASTRCSSLGMIRRSFPGAAMPA